MSPRILLVGRNGQVAWELRRCLSTVGELLVADRNGASHAIDLADPQSICSVVQALKPDVIVNAAAYTAVDRAEEEPELAMTVNGTAVGVLAEQAASVGAALVHYSTDYVFDGMADEPYVEGSATNPQSVYGRTKLAGEQHILETGVPHLTLRTSWVYGARGRNFLLTMRRLAAERPELRVVADQIGAPTWARHIAQSTAQILSRLGRDEAAWREASGTYHLTSSGKCSWFEFAKHIVGHHSTLGGLAVEDVRPIRTDEYPLPAKRPAYSVMSNDKLAQTFGIHMPDWTVGVDLVLEELSALSSAQRSD